MATATIVASAETLYQQAYTARCVQEQRDSIRLTHEIMFLWDKCIKVGFTVGSTVVPHRYGRVVAIKDRDSIEVDWRGGLVETVRWTAIAAV